jgi:hypothetical protein
VADWVRQRFSVIANDPILSALTQNPDSPLIIDEVLAAMARETASLEYDKIAAERTGQDPSGISNRRMKALRTLGETWLKKKREIDSSALDLDSPAFRTLFSHVMKTFEQAMVDTGLPREMVELVFDRVSKRMDGTWEQEIKTKIKNVIRGVPA